MSQETKNIIGTVVRAILVFIGSLLVNRGYISKEQLDDFSDALPALVGSVLTFGAIAWGIWQKVHQNKKIDDALNLPAGTSREVLEKRADKVT